nr:primosomal protein N' [Cytophagales bacterium]
MEDLFGNTNSAGTVAPTFADVILPVPIPKMFTYKIPAALLSVVGIGYRVIVPFGRKKILTGIIAKVHAKSPTVYDAKPILDVLDSTPVVNALQINFWSWMASYYCCHIGEVMNAALPSGLKISSESKVQLHPEFDREDPGFPMDERELVLLDALQEKMELDMQACSDLLGVKSAHLIIKSLLIKEAVLVFEEVKEKFQPKKETRVRLHPRFLTDKKEFERLFASLQKQPKQEEIVLKFLQQVPVYHNPASNESGILKNAFSKSGLSESALKTLLKNNVFEEFKVVVSRFESLPLVEESVQLSELQEIAFSSIKAQFSSLQTVLLHGITGSGKTEIYIRLIQEVLASGSQVLLLLPEIALTTQIVNRLQRVFGSKMGVYHSKFSDNERVEVWLGVLSGKFDFVVGVRSAIFLPFDSLGLIIVDEEHEPSYKQFDPAPRFQGRDAAIMLAWLHQAKTLLGSATPSFESFYNARTGKYGLVQLDRRYGKAELPHFMLANILSDKKKNLYKLDATRLLREKVQEALNQQEQVLVFQNRRGYAPYISCEDCGWIPQCEHCDVSLTYHQFAEEMRCHYCGFKEKVPAVCPACGSQKLSLVGVGTERIEENLGLLFPEARIARMDLDTTRSKFGYQRLLEEFGAGNTDILVGTQMISKGLDFDKVTVVAVIDADRMLYFPDFRAGERAFQMITQVAGRAGRRDKKGVVILQSRKPDHPIYRQIIEGDFVNFYLQEMAERKRFLYPPFIKLVKVTVKHKDFKTAERTAKHLFQLLAEIPVRKIMLGPERGLVGKIKNMYIFEIFAKIDRSGNHHSAFRQGIEASLI